MRVVGFRQAQADSGVCDLHARFTGVGRLAAGLWGDPCGPGVNGVYWKPVWNLLEGQFEVLLVNAQHIKAVAGRKTDQKDSEWIAELLQHG